MSDLLKTMFFLKSFNTAVHLDTALFACIERMACRTYFHSQLIFYRTCFKFIATGTYYLGLLIFRMNSCFHFLHLFPNGISMQKNIIRIAKTLYR